MKYLIYRHISPSGKSYVGLTSNIKRRSSKHKSGKSGSTALANAIKKYGWDNLTSGCECRDFTEVTRQKMSETAKRNMTEERRQQIREARLGFKQTEETKQLRRLSNIGRQHSEATKQKISQIRTGSQRSELTKQKIREARKHQVIKNGSDSPNYINISKDVLDKIILEFETNKQITKKFATSIGFSVYVITRKLKELGLK